MSVRKVVKLMPWLYSEDLGAGEGTEAGREVRRDSRR